MLGGYDVFDVQDRVIESILRSYQEQQAMEEAPKAVDPTGETPRNPDSRKFSRILTLELYRTLVEYSENSAGTPPPRNCKVNASC